MCDMQQFFAMVRKFRLTCHKNWEKKKHSSSSLPTDSALPDTSTVTQSSLSLVTKCALPGQSLVTESVLPGPPSVFSHQSQTPSSHRVCPPWSVVCHCLLSTNVSSVREMSLRSFQKCLMLEMTS